MFKILTLLFVLSSCLIFSGVLETAVADITVKEENKRKVDFFKYSQGQKLYQSNCATCHGKQGEGAKGWRKVGADGKYLAPPLNGDGHTWHHSTKSLLNTIRNGTGKIGGNMPAWKDKLSNREIKLILTWITAQWPDELYSAWYNRFHKEK